MILLVSMGLNFLIAGPLDVGLPYLAYTRLPEGAVAFGLIMSAFGGGSLIGLIAATVLPPLPAEPGSAPSCSVLVASSGVFLAALAFASVNSGRARSGRDRRCDPGLHNVSMITWIQRRIPRALMGRVMSLLVFASVALDAHFDRDCRSPR